MQCNAIMICLIEITFLQFCLLHPNLVPQIQPLGFRKEIFKWHFVSCTLVHFVAIKFSSRLLPPSFGQASGVRPKSFTIENPRPLYNNRHLRNKILTYHLGSAFTQSHESTSPHPLNGPQIDSSKNLFVFVGSVSVPRVDLSLLILTIATTTIPTRLYNCSSPCNWNKIAHQPNADGFGILNRRHSSFFAGVGAALARMR